MEKKPKPWFVRDAQSIEDYATRTKKLRSLSAKGHKAQARKEGVPAKDISSEPIITGHIRTPEEIQAEIKRRHVQERLKNEYRIDDRRDIEIDGEIVPNPRFGERLDS